MESDRSGKSQTRSPRRFGGPRVVLVGTLIVIAITTFIVTRILQTTVPGPDPQTIPERPTSGG